MSVLYWQQRTTIIRAIRELFWGWGFVEVDTPLMVAAPGQEPFLNPFETSVHDAVGHTHAGYLITSPEYALKKILSRAARGEAPEFEKIFQLSHVFRNDEDFGGTHNPEFMMCEWYRLGADYHALMNDVEELVCELVARQNVLERFHSRKIERANECTDFSCEDQVTKYSAAPQLMYQNRIINLERPWPRMTVTHAFKKFAHRDDARALAENVDEFYKIFLNEVEPRLRELNHPVHLIEYPAQFAALARTSPHDPRVCERVETYIAGLELTNGFSELTDATEQRARFLLEQKERAALGKTALPLDEEFLSALPHIKKAAGISLGVDRLLMLLLDAPNINEVLFWPAADLFGI